MWMSILTHLPWKNGRHFADDVFRRIFMNEMFCISIQISLKYVPKGQIDQIGDKPLYKPMLTWFTDAYMRH